MANPEHVKILKQGPIIWNLWRDSNNEKPDLSNAELQGWHLKGVDLSDADLSDARLSGANLNEAILSNANLTRTDLLGVKLRGADLSDANLSFANLRSADLNESNLFEAVLSNADLSEAKLWKSDLYGVLLDHSNLWKADLADCDLSLADLTEANLCESNLSTANLTKADLTGANLKDANLKGAICVETDFTEANIENATVYGISTWNIKTDGLTQKNLIITKHDESDVTVDNLEVAQFIYLILNNQKIRDVIGTIAKKGGLILGRFTPERKQILDAIREKLREYDLVPIMFDFDKAQERDFTETIKILAGMSRFVIVDITNPKSAPLELQATVPDYQIPFAVIKQKDERPFSMFVDLQAKYNWVLPIMNYSSEEELLAGFKRGILDKVLAVEKILLEKKLIIRPLEDDIGNYRG